MKHTPCTITSNIVFIEIFPGLLLSLFLRYKRRQQVQQSGPSNSLQYRVHAAVLLSPAALQSQASGELDVVSPLPPSLSGSFPRMPPRRLRKPLHGSALLWCTMQCAKRNRSQTAEVT